MELATAQDVSAREDQGQTIQIRDESGEPAFVGEGDTKKPVTMRVAGSYSGVFRRAQDSQRNRLLKQRKVSLTGDDLLKNQLELIASCILEWDGFTDAGKLLECNKENAIRLLSIAPWIREQVEEAVNDHQSFFSKPSAS